MRRLEQIVVLAGGRGLRMHLYTAGRPKILLSVSGRPFLHWLLDWCSAQQVDRVHLCLGHGADDVLASLGRYPNTDHVSFVVEKEPLGTAGALAASRDHLEDRFALVMGDSYMPINLQRMNAKWLAVGSPAGMVVIRNQDQWVPSNVDIHNGRVVAYDKARGRPPGYAHVDYGILFLTREVVDSHLSSSQRGDLGSLMQRLICESKLAALVTQHRFYEIGSPRGYAELLELCDSAGPLRRLPLPARLRSDL